MADSLLFRIEQYRHIWADALEVCEQERQARKGVLRVD